jgi:hypothetical protein
MRLRRRQKAEIQRPAAAVRNSSFSGVGGMHRASHLATAETTEAAAMEAATTKAATMEAATAEAAAAEAAAVATAHATTTVATATATAPTRQRHRWRSQANGRNCQQRDNRFAQHNHVSVRDTRSQPQHSVQVVIILEYCYWLRRVHYSTLRERR